MALKIVHEDNRTSSKTKRYKSENYSLRQDTRLSTHQLRLHVSFKPSPQMHQMKSTTGFGGRSLINF